MPFDGLAKTGSQPPPVDRDHGKDDRPRREGPFFMPDMRFIERQKKEIWRGMFTIRYEVMSLWDPDYLTVTDQDDFASVQKVRDMGLPIIRTALVASDAYRKWVRLYHSDGEILPHIQWGGHLKSTPGGDGGAGFRAWKFHALTLA